MTVHIDLTGRTALVTGASSGIGAATAIRLAEAGARVIVHYRNDTAGAQAVADRIVAAGGDATLLPLDLSTGRSAGRELVARAGAIFGQPRTDITVLSAGGADGISGSDYADAALDAAIGLNTTSFLGYLEGLRAADATSPGTVTLISSTAATLPRLHAVAYGTAKAAANHLVRAGAELLQDQGIRVNAVAPGATATPSRKDVELLARVRSEGRLAEPEDIADIALFLSSDLSRWSTGQIIEAFGKFKI